MGLISIRNNNDNMQIMRATMCTHQGTINFNNDYFNKNAQNVVCTHCYANEKCDNKFYLLKFMIQIRYRIKYIYI